MNKRNFWIIATEIEGDRAGSFRQERWVKVFLENGYKVNIITYSFRGKLKILNFATLEAFLVFRHKVLKNTNSRSGVRQGSFASLSRKIKHAFFLDFFNIGMIRTYFQVRKQLFMPGDVVMASSPPITSAFIIYLIKLEFKYLFSIIDMRDAWALHPQVGGNVYIKKWLEGIFLKSSNINLTVSEWLSDEFSNTYNLSNFHCVYNVSDYYKNNNLEKASKSDWKKYSINVPDGSKVITYTGSLPRGHFDLENFVTGVRRASKSEDFQYFFIFIGNCIELENLVLNDKEISRYFVFMKHMKHLDVQNIQNCSDGLLFFGFDAPGNAGVVSTKIFEYLFLKKPILPINVKEVSDVMVILKRFCLDDFQLEDINDAEKFFTKGELGSLPILSGDQNDFVDVLMKDYHEIVKKVDYSYAI